MSKEIIPTDISNEELEIIAEEFALAHTDELIRQADVEGLSLSSLLGRATADAIAARLGYGLEKNKSLTGKVEKKGK